jgi:hypothetical protein
VQEVLDRCDRCAGDLLPLLRANGLDPGEMAGPMDLRTLDLLVSSTRRRVIQQREHVEQVGR